MPYSAKWKTTDVSPAVVGVSEIPLLETNHENAINVPICSITVIDGANTYEVGDDMSILKDGVVIWRAVIESIDQDIENNTLTLNLIDAISKMKAYFAIELTSNEYFNAMVLAEDYHGRNLRYSAGGSSTPHRAQFLTLTHLLKTCLVKSGIAAKEDCSLTDFYGAIESEYIYYNGSDKVAVYYEDLAYHPQQIKYAKLNTASDPLWQGATLLDLFLYTLQVLGGVYRYSGDTIIMERRNKGITTPSYNDIYSLRVDGFTNKFDCITCTAVYLETTNMAGFNSYVAGALLTPDYLTDESNAYPDVTAVDSKIISRDLSLMRHAIVHRRKDNGSAYGVEELHFNAWATPDPDEYLFTYQYAKALYSRYPTVSTTETIVTLDDLNVRTSRLPIKKHLNTVESTLRLEY